MEVYHHGYTPSTALRRQTQTKKKMVAAAGLASIALLLLIRR